MERRTLTLLIPWVTAIATLVAPPARAAGPHDKAAAEGGKITGSGAFDRLKKLEGEWQGRSPAGMPMVIRYHAGAGGSILTETQAPGTANEMVTVYSLDGGDLVLTHYCPMGPHGNQPRMRLDPASKPGELDFLFAGGANLDPARDMHVHGGRIVFLGDDQIRREWAVYENGRQIETKVFLLSRKR